MTTLIDWLTLAERFTLMVAVYLSGCSAIALCAFGKRAAGVTWWGIHRIDELARRRAGQSTR